MPGLEKSTDYQMVVDSAIADILTSLNVRLLGRWRAMKLPIVDINITCDWSKNCNSLNQALEGISALTDLGQGTQLMTTHQVKVNMICDIIHQRERLIFVVMPQLQFCMT